jgi:hypothetical protein
VTHPLIFVRCQRVFSVPPVCAAFWTAADWRKVERTESEPLVIDALGWTWVATSERDNRKQLLYRKDTRNGALP